MQQELPSDIGQLGSAWIGWVANLRFVRRAFLPHIQRVDRDSLGLIVG